MPSIGAPELLIVLAIVVVLFGATRIGDIGKGIGRGIREFRSELRDDEKEKTEASVTTTNTTPDEPQGTQTH